MASIKVAELARSANSIGAGLYMPPYKLEAMGSVSDAGSLSDPRPNRLMTSEDSEDHVYIYIYILFFGHEKGLQGILAIFYPPLK